MREQPAFCFMLESEIVVISCNGPSHKQFAMPAGYVYEN